ncbi:MAG: MotA/TolQ/ExbB proton channel family protein [Azoarcus sp.]|jgi:biopolymer transport protein ExbB|nr:MotA/TolQ/ExbB proton channel family protein [Azoarcus sp.]
MNTETSGLDFAAVWSQGDAISHAVVLVLLLMSLASWSIILGKTWVTWKLRRKTPRALETFWDSDGLERGIKALHDLPPFRDMARQGQGALCHLAGVEDAVSERTGDEFARGKLRVQMRARRVCAPMPCSRLEGGLTLLASVGSTAPFVGLFGTVWGIYHALAKIGATGQSSLDKVAGPVGEALIMTAAGLFVAIPAVLAYNAFSCSLTLVTADMEAFAHDLHAWFTTGNPLSATQENGKRPVFSEAA